MAESLVLQAASGAVDPDKIRVVLYASNRLVHISLRDLIQPLNDQITALEARIYELESS